MASAAKMSEKLTETLLNGLYEQIVADISLWLHPGAEDDQATSEAVGMSFSRTFNLIYLDSATSDVEESNGVISINLVKTKKELIRIRQS